MHRGPRACALSTERWKLSVERSTFCLPTPASASAAPHCCRNTTPRVQRPTLAAKRSAKKPSKKSPSA